MSFNTMKISDLREVCEGFGIEASGGKAQLLARLSEEGVSYDDYQTFSGAENVTEKEVVAPKAAAGEFGGADVLVKMERKNFRYEVLGHTFTKQHPYVVMPAEAAQAIFDRAEGFRLASPREAQEYYG